MVVRRAFVTLFNSRYMSRGLAMYESLYKNLKEFILYIIAFDDLSYKKLTELSLENVVIISLKEFEDEDLLKAKKTRDEREYCWTCSSKSILYVLETYHEPECTYIDADLYFFSDPSCLIEEMGGDNSVLITAHRYSGYCDQTKTSGKYCVQFVTIKNDKQGRAVLQWWVEKCLEWCYARVEEGRFGDQKYIEQFERLFSGVYELQNLGGGMAPWNADRYTFFKENDRVMMRLKKEESEAIPVIFYHFQGMAFFDKDVIQLWPNMYRLPDTAITCLYKEYIRAMESVCKKYGLNEDFWRCTQAFRDNDLDNLQHDKGYYQYSLFL